MEMKKKINEYGILLDSFDLSPFELKNGLHIRSIIEEDIDELSIKESFLLHKYDSYLLDNAERVVNKLSDIYNFSESKEPLNHWWWHLDKVISGDLIIKIKIYSEVNTSS